MFRLNRRTRGKKEERDERKTEKGKQEGRLGMETELRWE